MSDARALHGVWEAALDGGVHCTLVLLVAGDVARVFTRIAAGGQHQQGWSEAALVDDAWTAEAEGVTVSRCADGDALVETVRRGEQQMVVRYRRSDAKQVLVYRRDLTMRKGKIAAQCAHASLAVFFRRDDRGPGRLQIPLDGPMEHWSRARFAKIVLSVAGEAELQQVFLAALQAGIPAEMITDAGKTEFAGVPTRTVVAVGPAALGEIDRITGPEGLVDCKLA